MAKKKLKGYHILKNTTLPRKRNISSPKVVQKIKNTSQVSKSITDKKSLLTSKQNRSYEKFLNENNLTKTQKSLSKFRAYENKMKKIRRTEKALKQVGKALSNIGVNERWQKIIKSNVIGYYKGAVGFTEKQFNKLSNDMAKLNDLELAKKVLPKIARPDTSQLKWAKQVDNLKDLTTALFRDDGDLYLELKNTIIEYNKNKEQLVNDKERGIKNMPISDYLSLRWQQEKELKAEREQEELAELNKYI